MVHVLLALAACTSSKVSPFIDTDTNTKLVWVWQAIQIPPAYLHLIMWQEIKPYCAWTELADTIITYGDDVVWKYLLRWLCWSLTIRLPTITGGVNRASSNLSPDISFPPITVDADLQIHQWRLLQHNLPVLDAATLSTSDQMIVLMETLQHQRQLDWAKNAERYIAASAPKQLSEIFINTTPLWIKYAAVHTKQELLPIYYTKENSSKTKSQVALISTFMAQAAELTAATIIPPVASKEVYDMLLLANLNFAPHKLDNLSLGINPFTCGVHTRN